MLKEFDLTHKIAVITGGARGIGFAVAETLQRAGADLIIVDLDEKTGGEAIKRFERKGAFAKFIQADLTDSERVNQVFQDIKRDHDTLDIAVHCAGICENTPVLDIGEHEWRKIIDVNLNAMFFATQASARLMKESGGGSIVCIGSNSGLTVDNPQPQAHYNASKAGIHQMVRSFAAELAMDGVRVNAVAPGYTLTEMTKRGLSKKAWVDVWTEMTPMKRFADPGEIALPVVFLASRASSYVTGTVTLVDGGYSCW